MDDRDRRIDQHVRTAAPDRQRILVELTDQAMKESLLRRILVDARPAATTTHRPWLRPRRALVAAIVLALLAGGGALLRQSWREGPVTTPMGQPTGQEDVGTPSPTATARAGGDTASCIGGSVENLTKHSDFAFDGTVVTIARSSGKWLGWPTVEVTFAVQQWFRGPGGRLVTVRMLAPKVPNDDGRLFFGYLPYATGSRMLVAGASLRSGAELHAAGCGFTRHYQATDAAAWAQGFAATPFPSKPPTTR